MAILTLVEQTTEEEATTTIGPTTEEATTMAATIGIGKNIKLLNEGQIGITDLLTISIKEIQPQIEIDRPCLILKENENYLAL